MTTEQDDTFFKSAEEVLRKLFRLASELLHARNIIMAYDDRVVHWLLNLPGWKDRLDSYKALDGLWHKHIANVIEEMMLSHKLNRYDSLYVTVDDLPCGDAIAFKIDKSS